MMKRRLIFSIVILALILIMTYLSVPKNINAAMDEESFIKEFTEALEAKDQARTEGRDVQKYEERGTA